MTPLEDNPLCINCEEKPCATGSHFCGSICRGDYEAAVANGKENLPWIADAPARQPGPSAKRDTGIALLREGHPAGKIARKLRVRAYTVKRWAEQEGIPLPESK